MVGLDIDAGSSFSKLELLFQSHESNVDAAKCSKSVCPACYASSGFTRKDIRRRKLRYLRRNPVTSILHVAKIAIRLVRWKCCTCKYTFTDYPDSPDLSRHASSDPNRGLNVCATRTAWPWKRRADGVIQFVCPECSESQTSVNPKTNLARCFRCERNWNPIDFTMEGRAYGLFGGVGLSGGDVAKAA